jgi:diguanylate cyclase (GGDEF)-like protein
VSSNNRVAVDMFGQADHFDWLSGYLQRRGFGPAARRTLAIVGALLTMLLPVNVLWGAVSISPPVALAIAVAMVCSGIASLLMWWTRWPTQRQSIVLGVAGSIVTAAWCLVQANPMFGLLACTVLVIPGGYIAVFHSARYLWLTSTLAVIVGAVEATRLALDHQVVTAITGCLLVVELNVAVPLAMLIVVRALMADLAQADSDPLTGLLNRRAFTRAAVARLQAATNNAQLAVAVIDLDRFKAVNDSFGHAGGDAALVAVAGALRSALGETALLGRMGGEEFVIADVVRAVSAEVPTEWGQRLRDAVAEIEFPVTASVGVATSPVRHVDAGSAEAVLQQVVTQADEAMYYAKRRGGNQSHHYASSS